MGTPDRDVAYGLALQGDGGFVVVATAGPYQEAKSGLLHRFNKFGHKLWQRSYGPGKDNSLFAIAPLANGGFAMAGQIAEDGSYHADMHLVVTDSEGKVGAPGTWTYIEGHPKYKDAAYGITVGHNNVLVMIGETRGKNTNQIDGRLFAVTAQGKPLWDRIVEGGGGSDKLKDVLTTSSGYVAVGEGYGSGGIWAIAIDDNGAVDLCHDNPLKDGTPCGGGAQCKAGVCK